MTSSTGLIIGAVLVAVQMFFIAPTDALQCYTCTNCYNTVGTKTSCGYEYTQCAEMKVQSLYGQPQTSRYCAGQCPSYGSSTVSVRCCSSDYCNTASSQVSSIKTIVGVVALLVPAVARF